MTELARGHISYNVYYSTISPSGPWTRINTVLIDDSPTGNSYTLQGLTSGTLYYIIIVGGRINEDHVWVPLSGQAVGPSSDSAIPVINPNVIGARPL